MAVFLKFWAKKVGIIGAANGFLSSYALILMIIAFLQSTKPPVLPCLQMKYNHATQRKQTVQYPVPIDLLQGKKKGKGKSKGNQQTQYFLVNTDVFFEKDLKVINDHYLGKDRNTLSVPELLYEFFYFFTYCFDPQNQVINVKDGENGFAAKSTKEEDKYPYSIVDPFETYRNPGISVKFDSPSHAKIQMQFRAALDHFK
mmetsp:Transcript_28370/g.27318  ORF Transcript_28370/g.27318 Transcript_28370/m.27318 type:complete len:200 (-) Transcript_28370:35-634(-)